MSEVTIPAVRTNWAWLRDREFDLWFVLGIPALAMATGVLVVSRPELFFPILLIDLWFLGYHHVIATYTRLCFDKSSFSEHKKLIVPLLPLVAVGTFVIAQWVGIWFIVSLYFYWQWFHYTRQSWGISRAYRAKERDAAYEDGWLDQAIFYAVPVLGILNRSYQDPGLFIGMELRVIPVSFAATQLAAAAAGGLLVLWLLRRLRAWRQGRLAAAHTLYLLTHFAVFGVGYLVIDDVTIGWLAVNIWHNAQYILFVWMFNTRRFKDGVDPGAYFLSYLSQPGRLRLYLGVCILITGVIYVGVIGTLNALFFAALSGTVVLYQVVNFHHYIVDSLIWKIRRAPIRRTLGLQDRPT